MPSQDALAQYAITGISKPMTNAEEELVERILREFAEAQVWRNVFAGQWEEVAELILPTSRNTFYYGSYNWPGQKKTDRQIDSTGALGLARFAAIADSLITPRNMIWHQLTGEIEDVQKDRECRLWFEQVNRLLFQQRYAGWANFASQNQNVYQSLGAFGTAAMFVEAYDGVGGAGPRGLRYKNIPLGELFISENHQGVTDGFIRWFKLTAQQAWTRWEKTGRFPPSLIPALEKGSQQPYDFLHYVKPRTDYEPGRLGHKGKPFLSAYVCIPERILIAESGFYSMPAAITRYEQTPGEMYGRSPAMMVLPSLKTLNAQKRTFLKQGHRAADPVLITSDDGLMDFSMRPGALNKGGMTADGKPLVGVLPTGNIQISKEMMQEERSLINDAFLVTLFQILTESPQMTATEVIERTNEKGILLAPTMGRQHSEYVDPMVHRELDVLSQLRMLPPMPPLLKEASGAYSVVSTSPLARAARAQEAAGFIRTVETVKELTQITGDQSLLFSFAFERAIPAIAEIQSVPESWMASPAEVKQKNEAMAKKQQQQAQIQAAPAQAAMMKAQAAQAKAGMGQQQQQPTQEQGTPSAPPLTQGQ